MQHLIKTTYKRNVVMTYADTQLHPIKNLGDPYDQVWLSQVRSLGDLSAEDWGYGVGYDVVSAVGVKGLGSTKIGIGFGNVFQRGSLTNGSTKSILTYEKLIKTHKKKLADYIKNPSKYDNKGFLKNAPTDKIRDKIIKQRINHLRKEINTFENNIKKIKKGEL